MADISIIWLGCTRVVCGCYLYFSSSLKWSHYIFKYKCFNPPRNFVKGGKSLW